MTDESSFSLVGRRMGSYQILSPLGRGGMGDVYRAKGTKLGREVAIKVAGGAPLAVGEGQSAHFRGGVRRGLRQRDARRAAVA